MRSPARSLVPLTTLWLVACTTLIGLPDLPPRDDSESGGSNGQGGGPNTSGGSAKGGTASGSSSRGASSNGGAAAAAGGNAGAEAGPAAGSGGTDGSGSQCMPACTSDRKCEAGECVCRDHLLECSGACIDPLFDPDHCGNCTTTCDEECGAGRCFRQVTPPGGGEEVRLALNPTDVFFIRSNSGAVSRVSRLSGQVTVLASSESPSGIAVDSNNVYWTDFAEMSITKVSVDADTPVVLATSRLAPHAVTVDSTHVYWSSPIYPDGLIGKVPIAGGSAVELASGTDVVGCEHIAVDAEFVYWTNRGPTEAAMGTLEKIPLSGGSVTRLLSGIDTPADLAVVGGYAYVAFKRGVYKVSVNGGTPTTLAPDSHVVAVAVDSTDTYVGLNPSGFDVALARVASNGTDLTPLSYYIADVSDLALDGTDIFWAVDNQGIFVTSKVP
jgi:hypothetical protein